MSQAEFENIIQEKHNYWTFENQIFSGYKKKIKGNCPIHGTFNRITYDVIKGKGCQKCSMLISKNNQRCSKELFVKKAFGKWGENKYDYSLVNYVNMRTKVCIMHDGILYDQTPENHLKYAIENSVISVNIDYKLQFIKARLERSHTDYDYSQLTLTDIISKQIKVKCLVHGIFVPNFDRHLYGKSKCPTCLIPKIKNIKDKKIFNTDTFIKNSRLIWGDKYDYSLAEYESMKDYLKIIYNGVVYKQTPDSHLSLCSVELRIKTKDIFIELSKKRFGDIFDYTKTKFIDVKTLVVIVCKKRGEFKILPYTHLRSKTGYPLRWLNTYDFINRSDIIHNYKYNYSKTKCNSSRDIISVICPTHGEFTQKVSNHLSGRGCSVCDSSSGELAVMRYLNDKKIPYDTQKKFKSCKNINMLPFDFWLPTYNVLIEFDGEQHLKPIEYFGGSKSYEKIKANDEIKNNWCLQNKMELIRIPHYDKSNIPMILDLFFNII